MDNGIGVGRYTQFTNRANSLVVRTTTKLNNGKRTKNLTSTYELP
jgi:hypothetical protein